ncbi:Haloacid dehalogenase-like hydrolase (HAD) superfamily protein [Euphorbia peplus]|nr:Haloacid dehalogenase-like hydrolase (HAD) superfamily protein [Euphorbia peplus]
MEPTAVAAQTSSKSDKEHSTLISNNEVKGVQAAEVAASANVVGRETSSNGLSVDYACRESKDVTGINKSTSLNVSPEKNNFQQVAQPLVGALVGYTDKKLIILDVNGLLADIIPQSQCAHRADIVISRKAVFKRPFCDDFLQFCFEKFNVGVWSSRIKKNVDKVVDFLMADSRHKLLFCWDQSHCTDTGFTTVENSSKPLVLKELKKLWDKLEPGLPWNKGDYNESNTLLLDDSPYKALRNPANTAIFPYSYTYKDAGDSSLGPGGDLRVYLEKLAEAQNVQEFVAHNPFGQQVITESNPKWGFYQRIISDESHEKIASSSGPSYTGDSRFALHNVQYGPQLASSLQESPAVKIMSFAGDNVRSGEILEAPQMHSHLKQQELPYDLHHPVHSSVYGVPGKMSASSRYPTDIHDRYQGLDLPDYGVTRSSTHFNPYASTFEKPLNSRFSSTVFKPERDLTYSNNPDYPSCLSHVSVDEKVLPTPGDDQYDPLLDSIKPSNSYKTSNYVQTWEPPGSSDIVPRLKESNMPLAEENNKKEFGGIAVDMPHDNEEFGETADAQVGDVENGSQGNPDALVHTDTGEMEIDQIKSPGKSRKSIDSRSMKLFKIRLAEFVKEVLDPSWRQGKMSRKAYKNIVKKTVDKVSGSLRSHQVLNSEEKINQYIESSQRKLTKLVMEYVDKHVKV